jgi:hypothetical protein
MPLLNPKLGIDFSDYIAERTLNFTGREWVFRAIHEWLSDPDGSRYFLLTGEPGSGKTSIAARLAQLSQSEESLDPNLHTGFLSAVHFCSALDGSSFDSRSFADKIARQLTSRYKEYANALINSGQKIFNIDINQQIAKSQNSTIQGIVIENLNLTGVSAQEAFSLAVLEPLHTLYRTSFNQEIIVLVDSLDEALAYSGEKSILNLISELQDLPKQVRFICTTRPTRLVLGRLEPLKPFTYSLIKDSQSNKDDIHQYITNRIKNEGVKEQLDTASQKSEDLVNRLIQIVDGIFLVAKQICDEIRDNKLSLGNLSDALKSLDEIHQGFLLRLKQNQEEWDRYYQPMLGLLSIVQEPITEDQISDFLSIDRDLRIRPDRLGRYLGSLLQYLNTKKNEKGEEIYRLYHEALREYLLDKKRNRDSWVDEKGFNELVVHFYQISTKTWKELDGQQIDRYGLRHLIRHLVKITRWDDLLCLLSQQTSDGQNAWFNAKKQIAETGSFLDDVDLLIQSSSKELSLEEFKALTSIDAFDYQVELIIKLASRYPNSLLPEALNIAIGSTDDHYRKRLLTALVDKFPPDLLPRALEVALAIQNALPRAKALIALANKLPEALPMALDAAQAIEDEFARAEALIALADKLTPDLLPQALNAAQAMQDEYHRAKALSALAANLPEALYKEALSAALAIQSEYYRAKFLSALAANLPESLYKEALNAAQAIQSEYYRAKFLSALAANLPEELYKESLSAALAMQDESYRAEVLTALANKIPEALQMALDAAQFIQNEFRSAHSLLALADKLTPELFPQALNAAQAIRDEYYRAEVLTALANKIPEALSMALDAAQAIADNFARAKALIALADKLTPELLPQALNAAQAIEDEFDLTTLLIKLINKFPQSFTPYYLSSIQTINSEYFRTKALISLASYLPENLSEDIKQRISNIIQFIQDDSYKATLKAEFASYAPEIIEGVKLDDI